MAQDWIIEVLGDLQGFAKANDLPALADHLDEAIVVATAELGQSALAPAGAGRNGAQTRRCAGTAG